MSSPEENACSQWQHTDSQESPQPLRVPRLMVRQSKSDTKRACMLTPNASSTINTHKHVSICVQDYYERRLTAHSGMCRKKGHANASAKDNAHNADLMKHDLFKTDKRVDKYWTEPIVRRAMKDTKKIKKLLSKMRRKMEELPSSRSTTDIISYCIWGKAAKWKSWSGSFVRRKTGTNCI